ncbi:MAG: DNA repair protein RadA [Gammaproteobacteria bacterium]
MALRVGYQCQTCGATSPQWAGRCVECGAWNTLTEQLPERRGATGSARSQSPAAILALSEIAAQLTPRQATGLGEFDRVLGGGLVAGSVVLIGGDPGVGKSTLLLQALASLRLKMGLPSLYVSGEESAQQIAARASRLKLGTTDLQLLTETQIDRILDAVAQSSFHALVVDSIQTVWTDGVNAVPGSISQLRECALRLVRLAKDHNISVFLVGHVTKEGTLAGPRVLEHMVDTVLYFEGEAGNRLRIVRAVKNRFGAVNEIGVFAMTEWGLREVRNPSAVLLSRYEADVPGSIVTVTREGTRPLLVEVQALVDTAYIANVRRVAVGLEQNRLSMLLAVMHRHTGVSTHDQDVFINVVGGVRIAETAADLPSLLAVVSSLRGQPLARDVVSFGEVGLSGEVRPVIGAGERLKEAAKQGFRRAIVPKANAPKTATPELEVLAVRTLKEALKKAGVD